MRISPRSNVETAFAWAECVQTADHRLMNRKILTVISTCAWLLAAGLSGAATIPAGTELIAYSVEPIGTHETVGTIFKAELEAPVIVHKRTLLPAGTPLTGVIEKSFRRPQSSGAVTVNLKSVTIHGRTITVQTKGGFQLPPRFKTRRGVSVTRETNYPHHTRMAFQLAQPLHL